MGSKSKAKSKIGLAVLVWGVVGAVVLAICGSERFAMAMGIVLGVCCLVLAVLACLVGPGGISPEAGKSEDEKTAPWIDEPRRGVDVVG